MYRDDFRSAQRDAYWSLPRVLVFSIVALLALYLLGFLATGGNLAIYRFWAPQRENAIREVFENTQGYVQGKVSYLSTLRYQYQNATGDQQAALRSLILTEASTVDNDQLPADLRGFITALKGDQ